MPRMIVSVLADVDRVLEWVIDHQEREHPGGADDLNTLLGQARRLRNEVVVARRIESARGSRTDTDWQHIAGMRYGVIGDLTAENERLRAALRDLADVQYDYPTDLSPNPDYFRAFQRAERALAVGERCAS